MGLIRKDGKWVVNYLGGWRWAAAEGNLDGGGEGNRRKVTLGKEQASSLYTLSSNTRSHELQGYSNSHGDRQGDPLQSPVHMGLLQKGCAGALRVLFCPGHKADLNLFYHWVCVWRELLKSGPFGVV